MAEPLSGDPDRHSRDSPLRPLRPFSVLSAVSVPFNVPGHELVDRTENFLQRGREITLFIDIAQKLLGQKQLPGRQGQHLELFPQMVDQVPGFHRNRLGVLQLLVLLPGAAHLEAVEKNFLPVDFFLFLLLLLLLLGSRLLGGLVLRLEQLQEGIGQQLLLEVLLQIHHRHVQHIHGLVEPWIDPELLAKAGMLGKPGSHATASSRARSLAVSVGPRYSCATRSSYTSSRTVPEACTLPSNMMYARSTMSRVCSTL